MSNWNPVYGQAVLTSEMDVTTVVNAEKKKVKVGAPCGQLSPETPLVNSIFGILESVTLEMAWDSHPRFTDDRFRNQTLCSK